MYRLVVTNRLAPTYMMADVTPAFRFQVKKPYLMFRDVSTPAAAGAKSPADASVYSLWFHDEAELTSFAKTLLQVMKELVPGGMRPAGDGAPTSAGATDAVDGAEVAGPASGGGSTSTGAGAGAAQSLLALIRGGTGSSSGASSGGDASRASSAGAGVAGAATAPMLLTPAGMHATAAGAPAPAPPAALPAAMSAGASSLYAAVAPAPTPALHVTGSAPLTLLAASLPHAAPPAGTYILTPAHSSGGVPATAPAASALGGGTGLGDLGILLSRSQLQALMLDLMRDDTFVDALHQRYVATVTARAGLR